MEIIFKTVPQSEYKVFCITSTTLSYKLTASLMKQPLRIEVHDLSVFVLVLLAVLIGTKLQIFLYKYKLLL